MNTTPDTEDMLTIRDVCLFFGGTGHPVDQSTIYRWIRLKKLAEPIRMGPKLLRWKRSDCVKAIDAMQKGGR